MYAPIIPMLLDILLELKSFKDDLSKGLKDQRDIR